MTMSNLQEAVAYNTYEDYCAPRHEIGLGVIPQSLYNALKKQDEEMFQRFYNDLIWAATEAENKNKDGSVNWNFVDSDMFEKWSVMIDGNTYTAWFDKAADIVEGVE
jgi:hypothetical protein